MIARIKGLKISQASERVAVTGQEMIPFQDGERNGKIRMIEFKDMTMYVFDPTITEGKISQEDYDALKSAIEEGKLIYTVNADRTGLQLATEVSVNHGNVHIESPDFKQEVGSDNISQVIFDTIDIDASLNYDRTSHSTPVLETTGDGSKVLTNDGSYVYIGDLALTNIKFKDGNNTSVYDLITEAITFQQDNTPCVTWTTTKSGNNIYMRLNIAKASPTMDGLMSKEDYVELNTTIPGQIEDLQNQGKDLEDRLEQEIQDRKDEIDRVETLINTEINRVDDRIDKEIIDRTNADTTLDNKIEKEIIDRKKADTVITNNLNAFISAKGQPGGLAELDSTGKVPASQLPSYVDDVLEYPTLSNFPTTGETGKIYVARDTNLTYRWTGNQYIEISKSLALGETSSTAYAGDKGKANRDAITSLPSKLMSQLTTTTTTNELAKINYKYVAKNGLNYGSLQDDNIDIPAATESSAGVMTSIDKTRLNHLHDEFGSLDNPGDKLNSLPSNFVTEIDTITRGTDTATINYKQSVIKDDNTYANPVARTQVIPAATSSLAGLMSKTDKTELDRINTANFALGAVTPNATTVGIAATKTTISTGASAANNITLPSATQSAAGVMTAADKVNLDVTLPNRITTLDNRVTTEVNNLTELINESSSDLTENMNAELAKKVGKVTVAGSGNAVTTASISGDTLTLTKGATYNNYVHPAGSAPSKASGFYKFSTDSTSHVASVTAVTKSDITNLGIQDSTTADGKYVKKAGDTMTGTLNINQTSSKQPLTLHGTDTEGFIQFANSGVETAEIGYANSLGTYLLNDKLTTKPCISIGKVDNLDEGAAFRYGGVPYKLLHKGNYANELDQRYLPKTVYSYSNGCLVRLRNTASNAAMITVKIFGNSYYDSSVPFDTIIQFYNYPPENKILQATGVNNGYRFGDIKVFNYDGHIYLWFKQPHSFETFIVHAYHNSDLRNMVESITDAAMPTTGVTRLVTITPKQSIYSYDNIAVGSVTASGTVKSTAAKGFDVTRTSGWAYSMFKSGSHRWDIAVGEQSAGGALQFRYQGGDISTSNAGMLITTNGTVGIATASPTERLHVAGNILATGKVSAAGGFFKESDVRLKSDIKPLDYNLEQICSIPTVSFIMNDEKQIGTIAQELEELGFNELVAEGDTLKSEVKNPEQFESFTKDGEEYVKVKRVEYETLSVIAIEGVKLLKDEIDKLKAEIAELKK